MEVAGIVEEDEELEKKKGKVVEEFVDVDCCCVVPAVVTAVLTGAEVLEDGPALDVATEVVADEADEELEEKNAAVVDVFVVAVVTPVVVAAAVVATAVVLGLGVSSSQLLWPQLLWLPFGAAAKPPAKTD